MEVIDTVCRWCKTTWDRIVQEIIPKVQAEVMRLYQLYKSMDKKNQIWLLIIAVIILVVLIILLRAIHVFRKNRKKRRQMKSQRAKQRTQAYNTQQYVNSPVSPYNTQQYVNSPVRPVSQGYSQTSSTTPTRNASVSPDEFAKKLLSLSDDRDVKTSMTAEQQRMVRDAQEYRKQKRRTYRTTLDHISFDLSWSENLDELLERTEVVYTNAELNCNRHLDSQRFEYYRDLHYRSFTAADLCHSKYREILPCYIQVKELVSRLKDKSDPLFVDQESYNQLKQLRDATGRLCAQLKQRRDDLNNQTHVIKEKIRLECGRRGQEWYDKLNARVNEKAH